MRLGLLCATLLSVGCLLLLLSSHRSSEGPANLHSLDFSQRAAQPRRLQASAPSTPTERVVFSAFSAAPNEGLYLVRRSGLIWLLSVPDLVCQGFI